MKIPCPRPGCRKSFEPAQNKIYCSDRCRVLSHYDRQDQESRRLWQAVQPRSIDPNIDALPEPERLRRILRDHAPPGAASYRVGAPNRFTPEQQQYLRWFPSVDREPAGRYCLDPFQLPQVPYAGVYVVAYFDADVRLLGGPAFKIDLRWCQKCIKWSHGDRKLRLSPDERRR